MTTHNLARIISHSIAIIGLSFGIIALSKRMRKEPNAVVMNYPIKTIIGFMYAGVGIFLFLIIVELFSRR